MTTDPNEQAFASLLYACTTDSLIPWDWLEESRNQRLLMTEWERVETLLRAANGERLRVREWSRLCGAPLGGPFKLDRKLADLQVPLIEKARQPLRDAIGAAVRHREETVPEISKNTAAILADRLITVQGEPDALRERVIAHSIGAALLHALRLAIDPAKPFQRRLRQCGLPECARFALGKPPSGKGQPPTHYCSVLHKERHRKQQVRDWKREQRRKLMA